MQGNPIRVVIDTNIWISFLIGKSLTGLSESLISGQVIVLFSDALFRELIEVLKRPKFKKYFSETAIENLVTPLEYLSEYFDIALIKRVNFACTQATNQFAPKDYHSALIPSHISSKGIRCPALAC